MFMASHFSHTPNLYGVATMAPTSNILDPRFAPPILRRLFAPLRDAIPNARFAHRPDHRRRVLDAASIAVSLVFFQMRKLSSLRALVDALESVPAVRRALGVGPVRRSTMSDALTGRQKKAPDARLLDFFQGLFRSVSLNATRTLERTRSTTRAFLAVDGTVFTVRRSRNQLGRCPKPREGLCPSTPPRSYAPWIPIRGLLEIQPMATAPLLRYDMRL